MTLKSDAKFKAEPACLCKCDMRNLANFHARNGKSQNLHIDGVLMSNVYKVLIEKLQRSYVSSHWTLNRDTKFEEEPTCRCNNDMSNLACFYASTGKSQNLNFDGVLVFKVYKVLATKLLRSYVSSHWTVMQNLEKNILIAANMAWGIWWILTKSTKIWNFMGSLRPKCTKNQSKNDRRITCYHTEQWSKIWIFTWELKSLKICTLMDCLWSTSIKY